jgi:hypothetical protein
MEGLIVCLLRIHTDKSRIDRYWIDQSSSGGTGGRRYFGAIYIFKKEAIKWNRKI